MKGGAKDRYGKDYISNPKILLFIAFIRVLNNVLEARDKCQSELTR